MKKVWLNLGHGGGEDEQVTKDLSFEGANIYRAWLKGGG